ncbi:MAG: hypothetical protein LC750_16710 [Actinobacteria bacterium]|nr:hypothetical protein [Actinomycetota bacterium]
MPNFVPGPSTLAAPYPTITPIVVGTPFSNAGAALVATLQAGHVLLDDRARTIASVDSNDLVGDYRADVTPALDALGTLPAAGADPQLAGAMNVLVETIANLDELATTLPSPFDDSEPGDAPPFPDPPGGNFD